MGKKAQRQLAVSAANKARDFSLQKGKCCGRPDQKHEKAKWRRENLRHFLAETGLGKGVFYSVNVRVEARG